LRQGHRQQLDDHPEDGNCRRKSEPPRDLGGELDVDGPRGYAGRSHGDGRERSRQGLHDEPIPYRQDRKKRD
jgi:hypothetical protein